jgi:HK97 family phage portal protein
MPNFLSNGVKNIRTKLLNGLANIISDVGPLSFFSQWFNPNNLVGELEQLEKYTGITYACVSAIAEDVARIEFQLATKQADDSLAPYTKQHPFLELLKHPNPTQSSYEFIEMTQTHIELAGEAFWYVPKGTITAKPKELWIMRPDLVQIVYNQETGEVSGYIYHKWNGRVQVPLELDEVIHFKMPNPINPYRGMGTVQAGIVYIQTEEYTSRYSRNFLANNATPAGIVNFKGTIPEPEFEKIKRQWRREYGDVQNAGKTAFLRNVDANYTKIGSTFSDINLSELKTMTRDDIMFMFRVSKPILGITENVNYASAKTAEYIFAKRVIDPKMNRLVDFIQTFYNQKYKDNLAVTYKSPIPQDNDEKIAYYKQAVGPTMPFMTPNEVRALEGLQSFDGGDTLMVPLNLVPLEVKTNMETTDTTGFGNSGSDDQTNQGGGGSPDDNSDGGNEASQSGGETSVGDAGGATADATQLAITSIIKKHVKVKPAKKAQTAYGAEIPKGSIACECCDSKGEHYETGFECYRCDASGYVNSEEAKEPVPCDGREDSPNIWVDEKGRYRHAEEKKSAKKKLILKSKKKAYKPLPLSVAAKENYRLGIVKMAQAYQPQVIDLMKNAVGDQRLKVHGLLVATKPRRKAANDQQDQPDPDTLDFGGDGFVAQMSTNMMPLLIELMKQSGQSATNIVDSSIKFELSQSSIDRITQRVEKVAKDFSEETQAKLISVIKSGYNQGLSLKDLSKEIDDVFGQAMGYRSVRIARTETMHEANSAAVDAYIQSGFVIAKEYYAAGPDPCQFCEALNGSIVPNSDAFVSKGQSITGVDGGTLLIDYEDIQAAGLHPNCMCTVLPVIQ